jgi:hypothetical protein
LPHALVITAEAILKFASIASEVERALGSPRTADTMADRSGISAVWDGRNVIVLSAEPNEGALRALAILAGWAGFGVIGIVLIVVILFLAGRQR